MRNSIYISLSLAMLLLGGCGNNSLDKSGISNDKLSTLTTNSNKEESKAIGSSDENLTNEIKYETHLSTIREFVDFYGFYENKNPVIIEKPKHGTVELYDNGLYKYTPYSMDKNVSDSFSYKVDINSTCPPKVVTIKSGSSSNETPKPIKNLKLSRTFCDDILRISWDYDSNSSKNIDKFVIYLDGKPIDIANSSQREYLFNTKLINQHIKALKKSRSIDSDVHTLGVAPTDDFGISIIDYVQFKVVDGKLVVDLTKRLDPQKIADIKFGTSSYDMAKNLDGDRIYIIEKYKLLIYDISNPNNPKEINSIDMDAQDPYRVKFSSNGDRLYIVTGGGSDNKILIFDLSNKDEPKFINQIDFEKTREIDLALSDSRSIAYIAAASKGILVTDISDLNDLKILKTIPVKLYANSISLSRDGNTLYFSDSTSSVYIYDVSNPYDPVKLSEIKLSNRVYSFVLKEEWNQLYIANLNKDVVYDISNPSSPKKVMDIINNTPDDPAITFRDDFREVYISDNYGNVNIYGVAMNLSSAEALKRIKAQPKSSDAYHIHKIILSNDKDYLYILDSEGYILVYKLYKYFYR